MNDIEKVIESLKMDRNCDDCIYHIGGECSKWECEFQTLADHDKQISDEVIDVVENFVNGIREYEPTSLLVKKEMLDKLKRMKGDHNENTKIH